MRLELTPTFCLWRSDFDFGHIPGPVSLAVAGSDVFVAAGGYGESLVVRTRFETRGTLTLERCGETGARGLRSILPLDARGEQLLVSGEYGGLFRSNDGGASFDTVRGFSNQCLYGLSRDGAGVLWLGGDEGLFRSVDGVSWSRVEASVPRVFHLRAHGDAGGGFALAAGEIAVVDGYGTWATLLASNDVTFNDLASGPGGLVAVADGGRAWSARDRRTFEPLDLSTTEDLERVLAVPDGYLVLGSRGTVFTSSDGVTFAAQQVASDLRLSSVVPWRDGYLVGGYRKEGPPYRFSGAVFFLGDPAQAPSTTHPIRGVLPVPVRAAPVTDTFLSVLLDRSRWRAELSSAALERALASGLEVNTRPDARSGSTLLHLLACGGREAQTPLDVIDVLVDAGADVNALDGLGRTPIMTTTLGLSETPEGQTHATAIAQRLFEAGSRVTSSKEPDDLTGSLHHVSLPAPLYALLHQAGARVDSRDASGATPLHAAARRGFAEKATFLLDQGADRNAVDRRGLTPLAQARRTRAETWVAHNKLTAQFDETIAVLEQRGAAESVALVWDGSPHAPRPLSPEALRAAATTGFGRSVTRALMANWASVQDLVGHVSHAGEPGDALELARVIG